MAKILQQFFTTGDVTQAAGITNDRLQTWLRNDRLVVGQRDTLAGAVSGGAGNRRNFSFYNVMEIALATNLVELGLGVDRAFEAAKRFAHMASGERSPAFPFQDGRTLFWCSDASQGVVCWKPSENDSGAITELFASQVTYTLENVRVVDVSRVFDRVVSALGFHPQEMIDEMYAHSTRATVE